jgi:23S rRNA (guanine2445-N2)-methyltransferase / 23S rRNA (guanine2069-N7)-methyltransferase
LLELPIAKAAPVLTEGPTWRSALEKPSPAADAFKNRVDKNLKHLRKWAKREGVSCFRVYDADLPEYAVAVDLYEDAAHVQEYEPPKTIDPVKAERRLLDVKLVLPEVLGIAPENLFLKVRRRQRAGGQYEKLGEGATIKHVNEAGFTFEVNLSDYLDTGLFLDHRVIRELIANEARGKRFLNLFCYTATASVYAARGGARSTVSMDLSNTYLEWARRNFDLNHVSGPQHRILRGDCVDFLRQCAADPDAPESCGRFGLIFLAPPTFSRSKSMEGNFDVQRDHVELIRNAAALLDDGGVLLFSNFLRKFKMDAASLPDLQIEDITRKTLPTDFARDTRIHNAWRITRRP